MGKHREDSHEKRKWQQRIERKQSQTEALRHKLKKVRPNASAASHRSLTCNRSLTSQATNMDTHVHMPGHAGAPRAAQGAGEGAGCGG